MDDNSFELERETQSKTRKSPFQTNIYVVFSFKQANDFNQLLFTCTTDTPSLIVLGNHGLALVDGLAVGSLIVNSFGCL